MTISGNFHQVSPPSTLLREDQAEALINTCLKPQLEFYCVMGSDTYFEGAQSHSY